MKSLKLHSGCTSRDAKQVIISMAVGVAWTLAVLAVFGGEPPKKVEVNGPLPPSTPNLIKIPTRPFTWPGLFHFPTL